jgi:serine/threonine protein phosphatase PrpC
MDDQDAVNFVMDGLDDKDQVARNLVREALRRGSTDNITVTVAWLC